MPNDSFGIARSCKLCGGEMRRSGPERLGPARTGSRSGATQRAVEELLACTKCYTLEWVDAKGVAIQPTSQRGRRDSKLTFGVH